MISITEKEPINEKEFQIDSQSAYVRAVVIMTERPPDYYYLNGRSISERKFEKLRKENPTFQFFIFDQKEAEVIAGKSYVNTVRLLFSE